MRQIKLGIVVAQPETETVSEIEKYVSSNWAEVFLFPEGYLRPKNLEKVQKLAAANKKWIVTGMDDDRNGRRLMTGLIIDPDGNVVGDHQKTSLTKWEVELGYQRGDSIKVIDTPLGKFGFAICYEIHFPEVSRILALQGAEIIFNPIGTGMWHEAQFGTWNAVAKTRAAENNVFVVGCSHYNDCIPLAFAYAPGGECLVSSREQNRMIPVVLDFEKHETEKSFSQRRPGLYADLIKS
jgi:predicted amidohydrolase